MSGGVGAEQTEVMRREANLKAAVECALNGDAARALRALRTHRCDERVELIAPILELLHEALERLRAICLVLYCSVSITPTVYKKYTVMYVSIISGSKSRTERVGGGQLCEHSSRTNEL